MVMNISCKFEKASYNLFFIRMVMVKSLYTLRRRWRNEAKSIVSTGCYPVVTILNLGQPVYLRELIQPYTSSKNTRWVKYPQTQVPSSPPPPPPPSLLIAEFTIN